MFVIMQKIMKCPVLIRAVQRQFKGVFNVKVMRILLTG
jgi:hypothetical protein